jgi:hypothetical protein
MRYELVQLTRYNTNDDPIELDDYSSGSYALYQAHNPSRKRFIYYKPDEQRLPEPRCDYILTSNNDFESMSCFIELKGGDESRQKRCCRTEWDHAFHQLVCTYFEYMEYIDSEKERLVFVLCTAIERKRIAARFRKYKWYKYLLENVPGQIILLCKNEYDIV